MIEKKSFEECVERINRSVSYFASKVSRGTNIDFDDAKQEMLITCWKAYQRFNPEKGAFSTFAVNRMRNASVTIFNKVQRRAVHEGSNEFLEQMDATADLMSGYRADATKSRERCNVIERYLDSQKLHSTSDYRAYQMFAMMRTGMTISEVAKVIKYEKIDKETRKTQTITGIRVSWLSRLFEEKIRRMCVQGTIEGV